MRILPVFLSFLIFLSLGSVQAKAIRADDDQIAISDSPVTQVIWGNGDAFDNSPVIPGPTYHLMFSDPALTNAQAQAQNKVIKQISQDDSHMEVGLDGADSDRPVQYSTRYTGGSRSNSVAPTGTTALAIETTTMGGSRSSRLYRLGRLGRSNMFSPNLAGSKVSPGGVGGSSVNSGSGLGISGIASTPRFGAAGKAGY